MTGFLRRPWGCPGTKERVVPSDGRFWSRVMVIAAAGVMLLGLAGGATAQASVGDFGSQAARAIGVNSPAATLAARRALVRHETSVSAERTEGLNISLHQASIRRRATQAQPNAGTPQVRPVAGHAASTTYNIGIVDDLIMTGPAGLVSEYCYEWGCGSGGGTLPILDDFGFAYSGEPVTVSAQVWSYNSSSTASEEVTVTPYYDCLYNGSETDLPSQTFLAPSVSTTTAGVPISFSFTVPDNCPPNDGSENLYAGASATVANETSPGNGALFAWAGGLQSRQISSVICLADSASPGAAQNYVADPVGTGTGAYTDSMTDAALKSPGYPLQICRTYSSADTASGPLGPGWSVPWDASLSIDSSTGDVTFTAENGDQYVYTPDGAGGFEQPYGAKSILAATTDSSGAVTGYTLTDPDDHHVLTFTSSGALESENDATGRGLTFANNSSDQVSSITDAAGEQVTLTYSGSLLSQVALPDGQDINYGYNASGQLTSVTDPGDAVWQYTYNPAGLLATVTDPDGQVTVQNTYNSSGQVTSQQDGDGNVTSLAYTTTSGGLAETDVTDPNGGITTYLYGGGMLLQEISPRNETTSYAYNSFGQPVSVTDPLGRITTMAYDSSGNLISETSDLGSIQSWTYDGNDNLLSYDNADSQTTTYTYNSMDEMLTQTTPGGQVTQYAYNPDGSLASATDARRNTTTYAYASDGMLQSATNPDGDTTSYTYDSMGYPLTVTDPASRITSYGYDSAEQMTSVTTPAGTTGYGYDADGNLTSITDPDSHTWSYTYNADDLLTAVTDPLQNSVAYGYDGDGNQTSFTDGRGIVTTTTFNADNLPVTVTYSDGTPSVSYGYDANGEVTSVTDGTGTRTLDYNGDGEVTTEDGFSYGYDDAGNVTSRTYPDGTAISYAYNSDGQVSSMTAGSATTGYSYDADGNLVSTVDPNGVTESRGYDNADQLTSVKDATSSATLDSYGLTLNADGQPTTVAVTQSGTAQATRYYGYDSAGRLTSECYSSSGASTCSAASAGTATGSAASPAAPGGPVTSGVTGKCMDDAHDSSTAGNLVQIYSCLGDTAQTWTAAANGTVEVAGACLAAAGTSSGSVVEMEPCTAHDTAEQWQAGASWTW
jgi:YD repeat-containing protein